MSLTRWAGTTATMAATAWLLTALGPTATQVHLALTAPQTLVDTAGADALLVVVAATAGWACWAWGAVGLGLTALSALPGLAGRRAGVLLRVVLPAGARRAAAVALGLALAGGAPAVVGAAGPQFPGPSLVAASATAGAPSAGPVDWPAGGTVEPPAGGAGDRPAGGAPDWPDGPTPATAPPTTPPTTPPTAPPTAPAGHVVLRGDCLWDIAADWLARTRPGAPASDAAVATAVHAWWQANTAVIGPDPDVLLPGQRLRPPS